ncbi:MAG: fasciclin domain-containing protein [Flavobacteriaceae bacterium]|nr:fasciclin domain-containing protein [Flavobacteriaceae bacterium]
MHYLSNSKRLIAILFILTVSVTFSQSKYKTTDSREITKKLGEYTTNSNLSLSENLFDIPSFSQTASLYKVINFEGMIKNEEMVTVFISDNNAFAHLSEKERKAFLSPANVEQLKEIVSYYVIPGRVDDHSIRKAISDGNGAASFRTLNGKTVRFLLEDNQIFIYADNGSKSKLLQTNFRHNKGFFHITDGLAIPQKK